MYQRIVKKEDFTNEMKSSFSRVVVYSHNVKLEKSMRIIPYAPNIFNNVNDLSPLSNKHTMAVANIHHKSMVSNTANAIKSQKNSSLITSYCIGFSLSI